MASTNPTEETHSLPGRNPDGTFTKGSSAAKEAGHLGGLHAHHLEESQVCPSPREGHRERETKENKNSPFLTFSLISPPQEQNSSVSSSAGRNPDGTFTKGSEEAKHAGHIGGLHAAGKTDEKKEEVSELEVQTGRNSDGTFVKGSEAAKEAGHKGGLA